MPRWSLDGFADHTEEIVDRLGAFVAQHDAQKAIDIFKSHARELLLLTWAPNVMSDIVHHAVYYESPTLSLLLCGWWQLVCSRPNLMPACWPLAALAFLSQTYQTRRRAGRLARAKRGVAAARRRAC